MAHTNTITMTKAEMEQAQQIADFIEMGVTITNTIENGVSDNFQRKAYAQIRRLLAREFQEINWGTWCWVGKHTGTALGRYSAQLWNAAEGERRGLVLWNAAGYEHRGTKAEKCDLWDIIKGDVMNAANTLIKMEEFKLRSSGFAMDDANRWLLAATRALYRTQGAFSYAERVWDQATD